MESTEETEIWSAELKSVSDLLLKSRVRSFGADLESTRNGMTNRDTVRFDVSSFNLFFSHGLHTSRRLYLSLIPERNNHLCRKQGSPGR